MKSQNSKDLTLLLEHLSKEDYCYLTTIGRVSRQPHEIEIWFGIQDGTLYLLSGSRDGSDWVKNLLKTPDVTVRIAKHTFNGIARIVTDEKEELTARHMLAGKYQDWKEGQSLSEWGRTALAVGIDLRTTRR